MLVPDINKIVANAAKPTMPAFSERTLLDYFAAEALPECSTFQPQHWWQRIRALFCKAYTAPTSTPTCVARQAYAIAVAMIAEREAILRHYQSSAKSI